MSDQPAWTADLLDRPHEVGDKAARVRRMFNRIARRYELVNTLFSAGRDAVWRREAVRLAQLQPGDSVIDMATGTGDFARAFAGGGADRVVGVDFAHEMLRLAVDRRGRAADRPGGVFWCEADALRLPFPSESCTVVSSAFGIRNFAELDRGFAEMYRVLKPDGRAVILEFTTPANRFARAVYHLYSNHVMPLAASIVSRDRSGAYRYLPRSVRSFPGVEDVCRRLTEAGFFEVSTTPQTMGVVTVYVARRGRA